MIEILPSLLAADRGRLADEILRAAASGADALHIDVMDAHFVPNLAYSPYEVSLSRRVAPSFWRHVHLMMTNPDRYVEAFADVGAQTIQFHVEADCDIPATIAAIRARGMVPALVVNPETPVEAFAPYFGEIDEYLVMSVHPGRGGQSFIPETLPRLEKLRTMLSAAGKSSARVMVDGGVNGATAAQAVRAGADSLVAGSYLFGKDDMSAAVAALKALSR